MDRSIIEQTRKYLMSLPKKERDQMANNLIDKRALKEQQEKIWKRILDNNN